MFPKVLQIDGASKSSAQKLATVNLVLVVVITIFLASMGLYITRDYDDQVNLYVGRLILVEVALHLLFLPFTLGLVFGVRTDSLGWMRVWIFASIFQAIYFVILNIALQVYISVNITVGYGILVLFFNLITEGLFMTFLMFFNGYYRDRVIELEVRMRGGRRKPFRDVIEEESPQDISSELEGGRENQSQLPKEGRY